MSRSIREHLLTSGLVLGLITAIVMLTSGCCATPPNRPTPLAFASPEHAVQAMLSAAKAGTPEDLYGIFGPESESLLSSGDPIADQHQREVFLVAMSEHWHLEKTSGRTRELIVGNEQWPFPIPLVKERGGWRFDTDAGRQEVLARRIGRNELAAIDVCRMYVMAQYQYASVGRDGKPAGIYARKVQSSPDKHDGLYWPVREPGAPGSPLGELAAQAEAEGYALSQSREPRPFRGYLYRILTQQGEYAPGGARNYINDGEMIDGFALIAYPAEYGNSGIMTFTVSAAGVVYEADLGRDTASLAAAIKSYNPDSRWRVVE